MKTLYTYAFSAVLSLAFACGLNAQNNIRLDIQHMLSSESFAMLQETQTPEGVAFNVNRMEYYISQVKVTHDGGQVYDFNDLWILADASTPTLFVLGSAAIESVESIAFSVGVNPEHNNLDPAGWPMGHPLALKNPSMHWGWASGYRFVAMEGTSGANFGQVYEVHALDNINYFETSVDVDAEANAGEVIITVYADYTQALKGIDVSGGVISHGSTGEAKTLLENFRDYVFTAEAPVADTTTNDSSVSVGSINQQMQLTVAPNPSQNGVVRILTEDNAVNALQIQAFDITGKQLQVTRVNNSGIIELTGFETGIYFIQARNLELGTERTMKVTVLK